MGHLKKPDVCARLGQNEPYGPVDVCGEPAGHAGPHKGVHRGMVWTDVEGRRDRADIKHRGTGYVPDAGGNIRGND